MVLDLCPKVVIIVCNHNGQFQKKMAPAQQFIVILIQGYSTMESHRLSSLNSIEIDIQSYKKNQTLLQVLEAHGVPIRSDCGGRGLCGKCKVKIEPIGNVASASETEKDSLTSQELEQHIRLACLAQPLGPVNVTPTNYSLEYETWNNKVNICESYETNPSIHRKVVQGQDTCEAHIFRSAGVVEGLFKLIQETFGLESYIPRTRLLSLQSLAEPGFLEKEFTVVYHSNTGIISVKKGAQKRSLGIALDLGSTTMAGYLCDLSSGRLLFCSTIANPQRLFGDDIISRIAYAQCGANENKRIHDLIIKAVDSLINNSLKKVEAREDDLDEIVVVGNPFMISTLLGISPGSLGKYPFLPIHTSEMDLDPWEIGLGKYSGANLHIMPGISGFLGADTLAGVISQDMDQTNETFLFMDLGTNGELVLGAGKKLLAASCATGPALEGGRLSWGVRAVPGAICSIEVEPGSFEVSYQTLDVQNRNRPVGLCGAGVINATAELLKHGLMSSDGRMLFDSSISPFEAHDSGERFNITNFNDGRPNIYISQKDVREVQLAKAAVSSGIKLLMNTLGIDRLDRVILTGSLGASINIKSAEAIGLIPNYAAASKRLIVTNAAGQGAVRRLLDRKIRERARDLARRIETIDLAGHKDFQDIFIQETYFPEKSHY